MDVWAGNADDGSCKLSSEDEDCTETELIIIYDFDTRFRWRCSSVVGYRTGTPLTQVRFPGAARDFFSQSNLSVQTLLTVPVPPPPLAQSHAFTFVRTLKIP